MADQHMEVPLDYFVDPEWFARERLMYERSPLALIASCEVAGPHDFLVRNALGRSLLFTRDDQGVAHAFLNACRHRGAEPAQGCGNSRRFVCPYHAWAYDSNGALVGMPLRDRHDGIDLRDYGLVALPCEERHGFVWVVLQRDHPIDVAAHLGPLDDEIGQLGCDRMRYYPSHEEARIDANWKSVAEGLLEGIHVPIVHAQTFNLNPQAANVDLAYYDGFGPHVRWGLGLFDHDGAQHLQDTPEAEWDPDTAIGNIWLIAPGLLLANELYGLIYATLTPGSHPRESFFRYGWLSPVSEPPAGMPSPEQMADRARRAVYEDLAVWEGCGRGLAMGQHGSELIGPNEKGLQLFHEGLARETGYPGLRYV
jgi:phenylpropionate dioxygenase-like ring-hydroxylating dioxygenase large terminal subunit